MPTRTQQAVLAAPRAQGATNVSRGQRLKQQAMADMTTQEAAKQRAAGWLLSQPDVLRQFLQSLEQRVRGASLAELAENPEYAAAVQEGRGQMPLLRNLAADVVGTAGELAPSRMDLATGMMAKVPALAAKMGMVAGPIVYHGTPYTFAPTPENPLGAFDASKIGTGEGAQAYGHGVYLAENPEIAKGYQRKLAAKAEDAGSVYTVDLPDEMADRMLDWDKPLSEQPPHILQALENLAKKDVERYGSGGGVDYYLSDPDSYGGEEFYKYLAEQNGQDVASEILNQIGIPGIKYFDRPSRDAAAGTRNFVVFPGAEKRLTILKRGQ